ncbi:MAG: DUF4474 domain-containing protein [Elusimicrobiales bacterium]|nr:DUF4474 domain-containing protein [Elusimicrobiales bacterium]
MKASNSAVKRLILFLIFSGAFFSNSASALSFEKTARTAGFIYDPAQDIYVTKIDSLQRYFGYNGFYDRMALPAAMVIDAEPVKFDYGGRRYMLELWKGQYNVMAGAEIGLYEKKHGYNYRCVSDENMIYMSYSLYKNGVKLFDREGVHWWLTGFKPGVYAAPEELTMENVYLRFNSQGMRNAFLKALYEAGYSDARDNIVIDAENGVGFRFGAPKNHQSWSKAARELGLKATASMVNHLNQAKAKAGRSDNSPETMDLVFDKPHLGFLFDLFN